MLSYRADQKNIQGTTARCHLCQTMNVRVIATERRACQGVYRQYTIVYCRDCGVVQTAEHYEDASPDYTQLQDEDIDEARLWLQSDHKQEAFAQFLKSYESLRQVASNKKARVLDIGCATGGFLDFMCAQRFECFGYDASPAQSRTAQERHARVRCARSLSDYEVQLGHAVWPDIVTLWDVFEHLRDPLGTLREIWRSTRPGCVLFISVPSATAAILKHHAYRLMKRPYTFAPWEHVFYYSSKSLAQLLLQTGFALVRSGAVACYKRPLTAFELIRRSAFVLSGQIAPRLAPQIFALAIRTVSPDSAPYLIPQGVPHPFTASAGTGGNKEQTPRGSPKSDAHTAGARRLP